VSIYCTLDGGEPMFLASNTGWGDFVRWLDTHHMPAPAHLAEYGWSEDLDDLEAELPDRLEGAPPTIAATGEALLEILSGRGEATVLTITDGLGPP
jgi:hypothetical protein